MNVLVEPQLAAFVLPLWLEKETEYANDKYGSQNPQLEALSADMHDGNTVACLEVSNYHSRFWNFYDQAEGNEHVLLKASQALGKMLNANRALLRVIYEADLGIPRDDADQRTFNLLDDVLPVNYQQPRDLTEGRYRRRGRTIIGTSLATIGEHIQADDFEHAADQTVGLIVVQSQLWVDFICTTGLIATPGIGSTDPKNELAEWMA